MSVTGGFFVWLLVVLFGLTRTPLHAMTGLEVLRWVGAAYLLWLAYEPFRPGSGGGAVRETEPSKPFVRGLATNLINPKAALFYLALRPGIIIPTAGPVFWQVLILRAISAAVSGSQRGRVRRPRSSGEVAAPPAVRFPPRSRPRLGGTAVWMLTNPLVAESTR